MENVDFERQLRLGLLSAKNLESVIAEVEMSPAFRAAMIRNLEAREDGRLSTEERMWLAWCKAIK